MHHLINELRPHQARETIRVSMQMQKRERSYTSARLNKEIEKVNDIVQAACIAIPEISDSTKSELSFLSELLNLNDKNINDKLKVSLLSGKDSEINELDALMCKFIDEI